METRSAAEALEQLDGLPWITEDEDVRRVGGDDVGRRHLGKGIVERLDLQDVPPRMDAPPQDLMGHPGGGSVAPCRTGGWPPSWAAT